MDSVDTVQVPLEQLLPSTPCRHSRYLRFGKQVLDVALALLLLPILAPVIAVLWVLVKLDGGPGFFSHVRVGRDGRRFRCWKLRTMVPDAEAVLKVHLAENPEAAAEWQRDYKLRQDPRITRIGKFLRRTSLDELPQIWNVLMREMSLVGPRPITAAEVSKYGPHFDKCFAVRPGITGLWQTRGRNETTYKARVQYDSLYAQNASLLLDLAIIVMTAASVLRMTGR